MEFAAKQGNQRLVVCLYMEFQTHKVILKSLTGPCQCEGFLFDLSVSLLCGAHGPRDICHNSSTSVTLGL